MGLGSIGRTPQRPTTPWPPERPPTTANHTELCLPPTSTGDNLYPKRFGHSVRTDLYDLTRALESSYTLFVVEGWDSVA